MEHEFPFGAFRPGKKKQNHRFSCSVASGNLPREPTTKKVLFHLLFNQTFRFVNGKQPLSLSLGEGEGRGRGRGPDKTGNLEMLMDVAKYIKKTELFYYNLNKILH